MATRTLAIALAWVILMVAASATYADPVAECQKVTATQVETGDCLQDTLTTVDAVLDSAFINAQAAADEIDSVTGRLGARQALEGAEPAAFAYVMQMAILNGSFFNTERMVDPYMENAYRVPKTTT